MHEHHTWDREADPKSRTPEPHHAKPWQHPLDTTQIPPEPVGREAAPALDRQGEVDKILKAAADIRLALHTNASNQAASVRFELSKIERAGENLKREES